MDIEKLVEDLQDYADGLGAELEVCDGRFLVQRHRRASGCIHGRIVMGEVT